MLEACLARRMDWGSLAFIAYDTCSTSSSPIRNCEAGNIFLHMHVYFCLALPKVDPGTTAQKVDPKENCPRLR